jgi:hypothetical protein
LKRARTAVAYIVIMAKRATLESARAIMGLYGRYGGQ